MSSHRRTTAVSLSPASKQGPPNSPCSRTNPSRVGARFLRNNASRRALFRRGLGAFVQRRGRLPCEAVKDKEGRGRDRLVGIRDPFPERAF